MIYDRLYKISDTVLTDFDSENIKTFNELVMKYNAALAKKIGLDCMMMCEMRRPRNGRNSVEGIQTTAIRDYIQKEFGITDEEYLEYCKNYTKLYTIDEITGVDNENNG